MSCKKYDIESIRIKAKQLSNFIKKDVVIYLKDCGYRYCAVNLLNDIEIIEIIKYELL